MDQDMSAAPAVSVIMPVHNAGPYLKGSIASILGQTFTDLELVIIDDGSTDGSGAVIASFTDPRIRAFSQTNQGIVDTLNRGIELARGRYIARMDADDESLSARLEKQIAKLEADPNIAVLSSFVDLVDERGDDAGTWETDRATPDERTIRAMLPRTNCIAHPAVVIRRSALGTMRYEPKQQGMEDWDLWLRMVARGLRIAKVPEALVRYRVHGTSIMSGQKRTLSLRRRLLAARRRFLLHELAGGRLNQFFLRVLAAQVRNIAGLLFAPEAGNPTKPEQT